MTRALLGVLATMLLMVAGCRPTYFGDAVPYPDGCADLRIGKANCAAAMDEARTQLGLSEAEISATDILTEDRCGDDRSILCNRSSVLAIPFRFTLPDGSHRWTSVFCIVDVPKPWCSPP